MRDFVAGSCNIYTSFGNGMQFDRIVTMAGLVDISWWLIYLHVGFVTFCQGGHVLRAAGYIS
jgi:hypothetical protein